jgi:DNA modification methylase
MIKAEFSGGTVYNADFRDVLPTLAPANLCIADVPYGASYVTNHRKHMPTPDMLANDDKPCLEFIPPLVRAVKPDSAIYLCTRFKEYSQWEQALKDAGATIKTTVVWDKGNWTAGDIRYDYANQVELLLFAHVGKPQLRQGRPSNLWRIPREPHGPHPTPKPESLFRRCILNSSDIGDTVLDPFLGSGTTAIAAILAGRRFIGIELSREFFDLSCERIEKVYREIGSRLPGFEPLALEQQGVLFE